MGSIITIDVPGEPKPWQVFIRRGPPSGGYLAYKGYQVDIQAHAKKEWGRRPLLEDVPLEIHLKFFKSYPNRLSKAPELRQRDLTLALCRKPDVDNLVKAAVDGIKGIVFKDDNMVVKIIAEKTFSAKPHTSIKILDATVSML
tara:strand:+ start:139 stop:567 length:429 start_codon:yes stop_codon:yes gene_type:complete